MIKVKICGLRSLHDVEACRKADALGFIVATPESQRNIDLELAMRLITAAAPGQLRVAVTTSADPQRVARIAAELQPDAVQVHAELAPPAWREIRAAVLEGVRLYGLLGIGDSSDEPALIERAEELGEAPLDALVLDTKLGQRSGGIGRPHDWRKSRAIRDLVHPLPVVLAGGLTPDNVREAIKRVRPAWIDVASGVEEEGVKSPGRVKELLSRVK